MEWTGLSKDKQSFPTKRELREKAAQIAKNASRDITEVRRARPPAPTH